jgi:hypothetical protein
LSPIFFATGGVWQVFETSAKASPDICLRDIVPAGQDALRDPQQIDFYAVCSNVDEHDLEA